MEKRLKKENPSIDATENENVEMKDVEVRKEKHKDKKKDKKEKKDKKGGKKEDKKENKEEIHDQVSDESASELKRSKKRKRGETGDEIEIDVNAPEPPSKKALRKLKKAKTDATLLAAAVTTNVSTEKSTKSTSGGEQTFSEHASQSRSKFGIWIGNLSFQTTKPRLEEFLVKEPSSISRDDITRINLPMNSSNGRSRGFAYIDFKTEESLKYAITLTESLLDNRRVLIKNANDFSNRNATTSEPVTKAAANISKNPPSKILYCGNLEFGVKPEALKEHFSFAGKISKVRLATFEDSGKCKGFGFVDFEDVASVKRAMLGLTPEEELVYQDLEGKLEQDLHKKRRTRAMFGTRPVTMEFGQDPATRYKKRFGRKGGEEGESGSEERPRNGRSRRSEGDEAYERKPRKLKDTRSIDPGAAYSADASRTGVITEAKGKKMTFDE